jgi:hypothetical protein
MKLRAEDLKRIYKRSRQESSFKNGGCPSDELLMKSFSAEVSEEEKFKIIDHATGCAFCYWKFEFLREIFAGTKEIARSFEGVSLSKEEVRQLKDKAKSKIVELEKGRLEKPGLGLKERVRSLFSSNLFKYVPAAAGVLIIILAALFILRIPRNNQEAGMRGEEEQILELISPKGEIDRPPIIFTWKPYPKALDYEVRFLDEELNPAWNSEKMQKTEIELPSALLPKMEKGKMFYWKVIADLESGARKESGLQPIKLKLD